MGWSNLPLSLSTLGAPNECVTNKNAQRAHNRKGKIQDVVHERVKGGRRRGEEGKSHERLGKKGRERERSRAGRLSHSLIGNGPDNRPFSTLSGRVFFVIWI